jgi:trans-aconitate methyltransferase
MRDYVERMQATRGEITEDMIDAFHKKYEHRLTTEERDALVTWIRGEG